MVLSGRIPFLKTEVSLIKKACIPVRFAVMLICFCIIFGSLLGCSQNLPEIKSVSPTLILEYNDDDSLPVSRLSIFIDSSSDVHRSQRIEIISKGTGYKWECDSPVKISASKRQWSGYTNFAIPSGNIIPSGMYDIKYMNGDGESVDSYFYLNYDSSYLSLKAGEAVEKLEQNGCRKNIAIFDKDGVLLYYGEKTQELRDEFSILRKYRNAFKYKNVILGSNTSLMCIMPEQTIGWAETL